MQMVSIQQFVADLCAFPEDQFSGGAVFAYLKEHQVEAGSLQPYLFFDQKHYTRNLIFRNDLFELMAICWERGQVSQIHNHFDQMCWMTMPVGRLRVQNFSVVAEDAESGFCQLVPTECFDIHQSLPARVDPAEPVHQVLNLSEFNERAVSLHIYSKPYSSCLIYSAADEVCRQVELKYSSEYGELCSNANG